MPNSKIITKKFPDGPLTKAVKKELKRLAYSLPVKETGDKIQYDQYITGARMLQIDPKAKTANGDEVNPEHTYRVKVEKNETVNHYKKLCEQFEVGGVDAVQMYYHQNTSENGN